MDEAEYELVTDNNVIYTVMLTVIFLLTIATNVLLLLVYIRNPGLITSTQLLHINLSCSNITLALFAITFAVVTNIGGKWIFPAMVCDLVGFFNNTFIHMTMFTAFSTLNERYHYRMNQRRHTILYTTKRVGITIAVYWVICVLLSSLPFVPTLGRYRYHPNIGTCWLPLSLLNIIPTLTNSIYIVLWAFLTFNLLTLPRVKLPTSLKVKSSITTTSYLPQLLTSSIYTVSAVVAVTFVVLQKVDLLSETTAVPLERVTLLVTYSSMILIPISTILGSREMRGGCKEVLKRRKQDRAMEYQQIEIQQPCEFNKTPLQLQARFPDKKYMSLPMLRERDREIAARYHQTMGASRAHLHQHLQRPVRQYQRTIHHHESQTALVHHPPQGHTHLLHHHHHQQRSQSLGRVPVMISDPVINTIEMTILQQQEVKNTSPKSGTSTPGKDAATNSPTTATSSVASSSTVGEIVDL